MINYFTNMLDTIQKSVLSIDEKVFNKLVEECITTIENGHKVVVSGLGKNVPVCDKFVGTMNSLGLHDTVCEVEEMPQVVKKFLGV